LFLISFSGEGACPSPEKEIKNNYVGKPPPQTPDLTPVNNFDIQTIKSTYLFNFVDVKRK